MSCRCRNGLLPPVGIRQEKCLKEDGMTIIEEKYNWARQISAPTIRYHRDPSGACPSCTAQDIHRWHWNGAGWGSPTIILSGRTAPSTAGVRIPQGRAPLGDENINTLGICLEGCYTDYGNLTEKTVPETQIKALHELCDDICSRYKIVAIKRHDEYPSAKGKDCPGKYFPWERFLRERGLLWSAMHGKKSG